MPATVFEFKAIRPGKHDVKAYRREIMKALRAEGQWGVRQWKRITRTWKHKPKIGYQTDFSGEGASLLYGSDDEILNFLNNGTEPHVIVPRKAKFLRFRSGYKRKTRRRHIGSQQGGPFGEVRYSKGVIHPGTEPQEWDEAIKEKHDPRFRRNMIRAMARATRAMNDAARRGTRKG